MKIVVEQETISQQRVAKRNEDMENAFKPIPSSSAYFRAIRERGCVYVDK